MKEGKAQRLYNIYEGVYTMENFTAYSHTFKKQTNWEEINNKRETEKNQE